MGTIAPAGRLFAAARHAAARDVEQPGDTGAMASPAMVSVAPVGGTTPTAPLDTTDRRWPERMAAHIERLRDAAADASNAADTRIRLSPDSLGGVEVAVRQEGGAVHVRFHAETADTHALLIAAQPQLAAAAEARGVRLAGSSVEGGLGNGTGGGGGDPSPDRAARQPARASAPVADMTDSDIRIA